MSASNKHWIQHRHSLKLDMMVVHIGSASICVAFSVWWSGHALNIWCTLNLTTRSFFSTQEYSFSTFFTKLLGDSNSCWLVSKSFKQSSLATIWEDSLSKNKSINCLTKSPFFLNNGSVVTKVLYCFDAHSYTQGLHCNCKLLCIGHNLSHVVKPSLSVSVALM